MLVLLLSLAALGRAQTVVEPTLAESLSGLSEWAQASGEALPACLESAASFERAYPNGDQRALLAERLRSAANLTAEERRTLLESFRASEGAKPAPRTPGIVYESRAMAEVDRLIRKFGPAPATVLIQGESGTGKELVARGLHFHAKPSGDFNAINLAAIPDTLLTSALFGHKKGSFTGADRDEPGAILRAKGGTLFLDEIGELPKPAQAGLLRFLQENEIQPIGKLPVKLDQPPRLVAATNRDLEEEVRAGRFREDLFYRLNVLPVRTPPLRERLEDILPLAAHFLRKYGAAQAKALSQAAEKALLDYRWPGNVRELENAVHRAVVLSDGPFIEPADLMLPSGNGKAAGFRNP